MKDLSIGLGRDSQQTLKVQTKGGRRTEATTLRDAFNRLVGRLQQALSQYNALLEEPLIGGGAMSRTEAACEGSRTHHGVDSHLLHREVFGEMSSHPREGRVKLFFLIEDG